MGIYANVGEIEDAMQTLSPAHQLTDAPNAVELKPKAVRSNCAM